MNEILRRQALSLFASTLIGGSVPYHQSDDENVDIALYATEGAVSEYGIDRLYQLAAVVEETFNDTLIDVDVRVSVERVVDVPKSEKDGARGSLIWWKQANDSSRGICSNLLLFNSDEVDWDEYDGYAYYNRPFAVATYYVGVGKLERSQHLAIHEIAHNFDLQHEDHVITDSGASILYPDVWNEDVEMSLTFSPESGAKIREKMLYRRPR